MANRLEVAEYKQERDDGDLEDVENHFSLAEIRMERRVVRGKKVSNGEKDKLDLFRSQNWQDLQSFPSLMHTVEELRMTS